MPSTRRKRRTPPTGASRQATPLVRPSPGRRPRGGRVGRLLPARMAAVPARGGLAHPPHVRAALAVDDPRRLAGAPGQPAVGAVPRQRPRRRAAGDGALLPARRRAPRRHVRSPPRFRARGRVVARAPGASARRLRRRRGRRRPVDRRAVGPVRLRVRGRPRPMSRVAAEQRALAMRYSDQWVREGKDLASPLIEEERAALVRSYAGLLAAVHRV